ncbi:MAG TPA: transglycosylase SLT domain-containing protein [Anaerolineae bacterium]|nr:transglycosylase SLT domain-containing protein [Anaerolineae bacterium]
MKPMRLDLKPWQWALLLVSFGICLPLLIGGIKVLTHPEQPALDGQATNQGSAAMTPRPNHTLIVTATPNPSATSTLTAIHSPVPLFTSIPSPTLTLLLTSRPTLSPTPAAAPIPSHTPSPTPTPQPSARLLDALRHQTNGDYREAIAAYQAILEQDPTPAETRQAELHLAESYLLNRQYLTAASAWERFLASYPEDPQASQAALMAARAYRAADKCELAFPQLQLSVAHESPLTDLAYEWIGDCHRGDQSFEEAQAAYRAALKVTRIPDIEARLREKLASTYLARNEYGPALAEYEAILQLDRNDEHLARIEYKTGQVLAAMDRPADAYIRYQHVVEQSPESEFAYPSFLELLEGGEKVDEFQAGLVYYYAGKSNRDFFGVAIRAFDRHLAQEQVPKADEALYYKALAQQALGLTSGALATLELIILEHPHSPWLERAWFEKAVTLARFGSANQAVKTCQEMVALFPASGLTPQALWKVANLRETAGAVAQAAKLYRDLQVRFPGFEHADEALWRAGFIHYLALDLDEAAAAWQDLADTYVSSPFSARALYWLGKLEGAEDSRLENKHWDQLVDQHPGDHYALRATQIRSQASMTSSRFVTEPLGIFPWDANEAEAQLLHWLDGWTEVPTSTDTSPLELTATLGQMPSLQRAQALLEIGLRKEAIAEFEGVLSAAWNDPLALGRLALFFHDQDLHGLAARCAIRLATLWPEGQLNDAPQALKRLAYPLVYTDLLSAESQKRSLDPLLLASLIRQESLFEPSAESSAGARGLSQVMPATGRQLARHLGMDNYTEDDLYRPHVSIELGAYYLATQLQIFDDQILVALAAYNGGPGNTQRWLDAAAGDLDLFVETITAEESRRYLRRVYEGYVIYETLYRAAEPSE